jgi:DNA primase
VNLIDLVQADGFTLKKAAGTHGGEYAGACPFCGGNDRFRVWPETGRYWCRGCDKSGDSIQYLIEKKGLSYVEACHYLGHDPGPRKNGQHPSPAPWAPKEAKTPPLAWQEKAGAFLDRAVSCLWSKQGEIARAWLRDNKGLNDATIQAAELGYNQGDINEPRAAWGLPELLNEDGKEKTQWTPAGLVIPLIVGGQVLRLRIRRDDPKDDRRFIIVSGSTSAPLILNPERGAACILESELDAILLDQESGDLITSVSIGTAPGKPDVKAHEILQRAETILISLDNDNAGATAAWVFWPETYPGKAKRWPTIKGKDPSAAWLAGLDLRAWIVAGIFQNEAKFERFCIQTVDGGMTDAEALRAMA